MTTLIYGNYFLPLWQLFSSIMAIFFSHLWQLFFPFMAIIFHNKKDLCLLTFKKSEKWEKKSTFTRRKKKNSKLRIYSQPWLFTVIPSVCVNINHDWLPFNIFDFARILETRCHFLTFLHAKLCTAGVLKCVTEYIVYCLTIHCIGVAPLCFALIALHCSERDSWEEILMHTLNEQFGKCRLTRSNQ